MPFQKGNSLGGRKPGSPNKITTKIREGFEKLLTENLEGLNEDIQKLHPKERIQAYVSLANFVLPKLAASTVDLNEPFKEQSLFLMPEQIEEMKNISDEAFTQVSGRSSKSCIDGYED